jgi:hypothetical protein
LNERREKYVRRMRKEREDRGKKRNKGEIVLEDRRRNKTK